jgi:5-methylcytosine-specific restriction protein B
LSDIGSEYKTWDEFLARWPVSAVEAMTLDEYTGLDDKETFTYWLEHRLIEYGSIRGGSAYKFGVFRKANTSKEHPTKSYKNDDKYAWHEKFGTTSAEAFVNVKQHILDIVTAVKSNELSRIESCPLAHTLKWKVAFHYQDQKSPTVLGVFNLEALQTHLGKKLSMAEALKVISSELSYENLITKTDDIWNEWADLKSISIWKISHGKNDISENDSSWLDNNNYISLHKNTAKGQAKQFVSGIKEGDYALLVRSSTVKAIVKITSDVVIDESSPLDEDWMLRSYQMIYWLDEPKKFVSDYKKGWTPNFNTTFKSVGTAELPKFENLLLQPFFNVSLAQLIQEGDNIVPDYEQVKTASPKALVTNKDTINTIFYGPPGTGKTYRLQQLLIDNYTDIGRAQERTLWLNEILDELSWFEISTIILLDAEGEMSVTDIIEHEFFRQKLKLNDRKSNIRQTAWAALQTHAIKESTTVKYEKRNEPLIFDKTNESRWFIVDKSNEILEEYKDLCLKLNLGPQTEEEIKRFEFVTFHQSYGYEEFIEGLRPVTNAKGDISYKVKPGVFKRLCKKAEEDPNHQYALVIDEINRGNISKIFGELISLIEIDKREGCDHALSVTLPYSGLPFSVPSNVDIIGSMNTADRSLTHIDVALRRRFEFKELRTNYSLLESDVEGINIKHMLYAMNQRIELLLDREHILGHALLMKVTTLNDLESAFKNSIMPLLEEYFFEDWGQINQVLNSNAFIEEKTDARSTWLGSTDEYAAKSYKVDFNALNKVEEYQKVYANIDPKAFTECDVE